MKDSIEYVTITNKCPEKIRIYFHYVMYTKPSFRKKRKKSILLLPDQESYPIAKANLVGGKNWDIISQKPCVIIQTVQHEPKFFHIKNTGKEQIKINIEPTIPEEVTARYPRRTTVVTLKPGTVSRAIELKSVHQPEVLEQLVRSRKAAIRPADIGPGKPRKPGIVGSFYGEGVYICYECGGPIVFRGYPPRPVHI